MAAMMAVEQVYRHPLPATMDLSLDQQLRALVRDVPDFPKPGILFRDLSPLMRDPHAWRLVVEGLAAKVESHRPELIVGIEARGFLVGNALAFAMDRGFVPVRKPGKLPGPVEAIDYSLEYGSDRLEIQEDALAGAPRVLIIDDLLATGGTAAACASLVEKAGGVVCGYGFVAELTELSGRNRLQKNLPIEALISY
jgi:adenine phosphoribosyltransferase